MNSLRSQAEEVRLHSLEEQSKEHCQTAQKLQQKYNEQLHLIQSQLEVSAVVSVAGR